MKKTIIYLTLLIFCASIKGMAQDTKVDFRVAAGYNIGGRTPLGLPAAIRSINSFTPLLNLTLGGYANFMFTPEWGLATGIRYEGKGMETGATVVNYRMTMVVNDGDQLGRHSGYFTGDIVNRSQSDYLTIPIVAVFRPNSNWEIRAGGYASYALKGSFTGSAQNGFIRETPLHEKIGVDFAEYDFSTDLRKFDIGMEVGADLKVYKKLAVTANLLWGLTQLLDPATRSIDMNMYNIFLNVGLAYRF